MMRSQEVCDVVVEKTSKLDRLAALSTFEDVNTDVPGNNLGRAFIAAATNITRAFRGAAINDPL
jgi:hypothetical protein